MQEASTSLLHQLLATMTVTDPAQRPSLRSVVSSCALHASQGVTEEVNSLIALILGIGHDDVSIVYKVLANN